MSKHVYKIVEILQKKILSTAFVFALLWRRDGSSDALAFVASNP